MSCLISEAGEGISHAIGVGGRDLKKEIGGITTLMAIDAFDADPADRSCRADLQAAASGRRQGRLAADRQEPEVLHGVLHRARRVGAAVECALLSDAEGAPRNWRWEVGQSALVFDADSARVAFLAAQAAEAGSRACLPEARYAPRLR